MAQSLLIVDRIEMTVLSVRLCQVTSSLPSVYTKTPTKAARDTTLSPAEMISRIQVDETSQVAISFVWQRRTAAFALLLSSEVLSWVAIKKFAVP